MKYEEEEEEEEDGKKSIGNALKISVWIVDMVQLAIVGILQITC